MGIENFTELGFVTIPYHKKNGSLDGRRFDTICLVPKLNFKKVNHPTEFVVTCLFEQFFEFAF